MSMAELTAYQLVYIFVTYAIMTIVLPSLVFGPRIRHYSFAERLMAYVLIGNFFMMNLVFVLELLHISYRPVIIISTVVLCFIAAMRARDKNALTVVVDMIDMLRRRMSGTVGNKQLAETMLSWLSGVLRSVRRWLVSVPLRHLPEWLGFFGIMAYIIYVYSPRDFSYYGYSASDMIVHNYWINALSDNKLFAGGIYPMGYHNVMYYLHTVFGMETFTLLRLFGIVQLCFVAMMLYMFLRAVTRGALFPMLGVFIYVGLDVWNGYTISRFSSPLPQEYGIMFILPAIYFLLKYLRIERSEEKIPIPVEGNSLIVDEEDLYYSDGYMDVKHGKQELITVDDIQKKSKRRLFKKKRYAGKSARIGGAGKDFVTRLSAMESLRSMTLFSIGFSMTIAVHFYDTMVAGIGCVAVAIAFLPHILRPDRVRLILQAGIASLLLAVYPMAICFALGTPLQGSMGWAMNVMKGENSSEADRDSMNAKYEERIKNAESVVWRDGVVIGIDGEPVNGATYEDLEGLNTVTTDDEGNVIESEVQQPTTAQRLIRKFWDVYNSMSATFSEAVLNNNKYSFNLDLVIYMLFASGIIMAVANMSRDSWYGRTLLAMVLFGALLMSVFVFGDLGLPRIMDINRTRVFFVYIIAAMATMIFDSLPYFLFGQTARGRVSYVAGIICVTILMGGFIGGGSYRTAQAADETMSRNGAIVCLAGITREIPDHKWTIVSANDEMRMGEDHGYHYESINFLREMADYTEDTSIYIPTEYVFFYVEKVPVNYDNAAAYEGSGQPVSVAGARQDIPRGKGLSVYIGENRWIVMSKLYFWIKEFKKLYPNEVTTYYEDKNFVCYMVHQNERALYNFAIDYDYNGTLEEPDEKADD